MIDDTQKNCGGIVNLNEEKCSKCGYKLQIEESKILKMLSFFEVKSFYKGNAPLFKISHQFPVKTKPPKLVQTF